MICRLTSIIDDVRAMLNLNVRRNGPLACGDIETLTLDRRIATLLPEAVRRAELEADASLLVGSPSFAAEPLLATAQPGIYTVDLPPDFMRLVEFRLASWSAGTGVPVAAGSNQWQVLATPGAETLAYGQFPLVAIRHDPGGSCLLCRGATPVDAIAVAAYRREPRLSPQGAVEIAEPLYHTVINLITSLLQ